MVPTQAPRWRRVTLALLGACVLLALALLTLVGRQFLAPFDMAKQAALLRAQNDKLKDTAKELQISRGGRCGPCPEQWEQRGDFCYHFSEQRLAWGKCGSLCGRQNSELLRIESPAEAEFAALRTQRHAEGLLQPLRLARPHWIGLFFNATAERWTWNDGTAFQTTWFKQGPAGANQSKKCGLFLNGQYLHRWCREKHHCICRRKRQ
ncbi:C-type lectin domain family 1 member A-like [Eudromia elegans]